jgi:hypothetical protein
MKNFAVAEEAIAKMKDIVATAAEDVDTPPALVQWLARLRLMEGVPFAYLMAHDELLPPESIRFFYVNRNWTDAAVDGAVSIGAATSRDRELIAASHGALVEAIDRAEWLVRSVEEPVDGPAGVLTGFLLRSRAVSGWPGLEVHAERGPAGTPERVRFLRFERLAPAVLFVLMDGIPDRVRIEEPRQGIQFGVDLPSTGPRVPLKNRTTGEPLEQSNIVGTPGTALITDAKLKVPFRQGAPGVVHVTELARRLQLTTSNVPAPTQPLVTDDESSDELAVQMLQFPYCQPFENAEGGTGWFRASLPLQIVLSSHGD